MAADSPEAVAWSLGGALERVIGDVEDPAVEWTENLRRQALLSQVFAVCGADLTTLNDVAHRQDVVVSLLSHSCHSCAIQDLKGASPQCQSWTVDDYNGLIWPVLPGSCLDGHWTPPNSAICTNFTLGRRGRLRHE